jgi:hypothetical protein
MRIWAWLNHDNHGFVQASLRHDWQFATDRQRVAAKVKQPPYFGSSFGDLAGQTGRPSTEIVVTHRGSSRIV